MNRNVHSKCVVAAALAALALAGCSSNSDRPGDAGADRLSGSVVSDGSSTVAPLTSAAQSIFNEQQTDVKITVGTSGTGGGFEKFCKGETDLSNASRPIKDTEKAACDAAGVKYTELQVANDALTVVVSKDNTWAECLTVDQLKRIWEPGSKVNTWNQVDPKFPAEPLKLFGPGTDSGTFDYFTDEINGAEGKSRTDYTPSENDNLLVQGVAGTKGGLGYFGFSYYEENTDKLKAVQVDGGAGCVVPSLQAASDGTYKPLARPLFLYVNNKSMGEKPPVKGFVEFYAKNIDEIIKEAKFVPLNAEQKSKLTADVESAAKG